MVCLLIHAVLSSITNIKLCRNALAIGIWPNLIPLAEQEIHLITGVSICQDYSEHILPSHALY